MRLTRFLFPLVGVLAAIALATAAVPPDATPAAPREPAVGVKADAPADPGKDAPKADKDARKLGRAKPKAQYDYGHFRAVVGTDGKTRYFPRLGKSVDTAKRAVALPESVDYSAKGANVLKRMYLNNQYGCCVISSRYHQIGFQTAADTGTGLEADDAEIYSAYQTACGRGDNGCDMSAVNVYQQRVGLKVKGTVHKSDGSVAIDNTNKEVVKAAIYCFGGVNVGFLLPNEWYQSANGSDWGITNSGIVGGHEVQAYGYDAKGVLISTWGGNRRILWEAFNSRRWIDETYTTLTADWYGSDRIAPSGIDAESLAADLALVAGGKVPPLPNPDPPNPPGPVPPNPPTPGKFSGTITKVQTYKDGIAVGPELTIVGNGTGSDVLADELKAAGLSPALIVDVLQLLADLKAKPRDPMKILADLAKIMGDFAAKEPVPEPMPFRKPAPAPEGKAEPGSCIFLGADRLPWPMGRYARVRVTGEYVLTP